MIINALIKKSCIYECICYCDIFSMNIVNHLNVGNQKLYLVVLKECLCSPKLLEVVLISLQIFIYTWKIHTTFECFKLSIRIFNFHLLGPKEVQATFLQHQKIKNFSRLARETIPRDDLLGNVQAINKTVQSANPSTSSKVILLTALI